jgi:hypothetical protein
MNWGFCMVGNEEAFCAALKLAQPAEDREFIYWEIGLGQLQTFYAVADCLDSFARPFRMTGVDVPAWTPALPSDVGDMEIKGFRLFLQGSAAFFASNPGQADFIFIDGCHSYDCAKADFLGAEKCIRSGGIVCLHDVNPEIQGTEPQNHCNGAPIGVRKACEHLGLLDGTRPGWKLVRETTGDTQKGGRGCLFFQKL